MQVDNIFKNDPFHHSRFSVWIHSTGRRKSELEEQVPVKKKRWAGGTGTRGEETVGWRDQKQMKKERSSQGTNIHEDEMSQMADDYDYGDEISL